MDRGAQPTIQPYLLLPTHIAGHRRLTPMVAYTPQKEADTMDSHDPADMALTLIEEQAEERIRRTWHEDRWFFSVIDLIGLLTDSARPRKYWADMKQRITDEGFLEVSAKCGQLKMRSPDGKQRVTDAADVETLLRIIQSIPSPKAEPVKQ